MSKNNKTLFYEKYFWSHITVVSYKFNVKDAIRLLKNVFNRNKNITRAMLYNRLYALCNKYII